MGTENSGEAFQVFEIALNFFFYALLEGGGDWFFPCHRDIALIRGDVPLPTIAFYIIYTLQWHLSNVFISFHTQEHY